MTILIELFDDVKKNSLILITETRLDSNIYMHAYDILIEASDVQHHLPGTILYILEIKKKNLNAIPNPNQN